MERRRIAPQTGIGFELRRGQLLTVTDPLGEQVADLIAFALGDKREWLSSGRTIDYANTIYISTGHLLYSNRSRVMLRIEEDTVGRHDFLLTPCSRQTFEIIYGHKGPHPSCLDNIVSALGLHGIAADNVPTTLNLFMNVAVGSDGALTIGVPHSRAGGRIRLRAEMDLWVAVTACSAELSNNGTFKPIDVEWG